MFIFVFVVSLIGVSLSKHAPDFIHPCSDTSSACLIKATQDSVKHFVKGLPEFEIPVLDPYILENGLNLTLPGGLDIKFRDGKITGLKSCIIDNVVSKLEERKFILESHCNLTIRGKYTANGRILILTIAGDGDAKIKLFNLRVAMDVNTKYVKDNNNKYHFGIQNFTYTFDYGDKMTFQMTNLFKGNPELSNTILTFLNENWRPVANEVGSPIVDFVMNLIVNTIEKFFLAVPYEELLNVPIPTLS